MRRSQIDFGDMALALALWICTLPLTALLVVPFWGLKIGAIVAVGLFFVTMAVCWGFCGWKAYKTGI